jgi:AcrR family transcriptional regulator
LSRERVLDAALAIADRDGLAALTMRKLGGELGVEAMTLYHHLPNKDALLDGLVERVLELATPPEGGDWAASMRGYAISLRAILKEHPGVLSIAATRPAVTPRTLQIVERSLALLRGAGFELGLALDLVNALSVFVIGHVAAEMAIPAAPVMDTKEFPLLDEAVRTGAGVDDETRFLHAVDALLVGFGQASARPTNEAT